MKLFQLAFVLVAVLLLSATSIEGKRKKHHHKSSKSPSTKTKTKTKWSTSIDSGANSGDVATEEHGYYVKRTFAPLSATGKDSLTRQSPPYLAIPIAWFGCQGDAASCLKGHSTAISSNLNALSEGFLCDDDCSEAYDPICGKSPNEVAVFYSKCKLNVAKCRSHGLWMDISYEECQKTYPKEVEYTDKKFRCSPFFRDNSTVTEEDSTLETIEQDAVLEAALEALSKIDEELTGIEDSDDEDSKETNSLVSIPDTTNKVSSDSKKEATSTVSNVVSSSETNKEATSTVATNNKIESTTVLSNAIKKD